MLARTSPLPFSINVSKAEGSYVYDIHGNAYLDFIAGIGVNNLGHGVKEITQAVSQQMEKHSHVMVYGEFEQEVTSEFATKLTSLLPDHLNTVYPVNSGTEANEAAIKLSRKATGRNQIIGFKGAYHGNTTGSMSISYREAKKTAFRPLIPGNKFIQLNDLDGLNSITKETAGVILETIQGDAGVQIPTSDFMRALRERCNEVGALLILDEIQCGYGRTGKFSAFEHYGVSPDILTLGKALGAGLPIGALVANSKTLAEFETKPKLGHITTFGGNPVVAAAALAGLNYLSDKELIPAVEKKGQLIEQLIKPHKAVSAFRRKGLMIGIELASEETTSEIILKAKERGLLLFWFLSIPNGFRISPPLTISNEEIKKGCSILLDLLDQVV